MHMFTSHDVVGTILARDDRIGMESVLAKLFPRVKYHYHYNEGAFRKFVDPSQENMTLGGEPLEEFGLRYKYKCPFVTCSRTTRRGAGKMMGYKE